MGLEGMPVDDVDRPIEQCGNIIFEGDILVHADRRRRLDLYHDVDVDVAVATRIAAGARAENGVMADAAHVKRLRFP